MGLLCGRAGRLTTKHGGFRPRRAGEAVRFYQAAIEPEEITRADGSASPGRHLSFRQNMTAMPARFTVQIPEGWQPMAVNGSVE